jgi:hypothetical protein
VDPRLIRLILVRLTVRPKIATVKVAFEHKNVAVVAAEFQTHMFVTGRLFDKRGGILWLYPHDTAKVTFVRATAETKTSRILSIRCRCVRLLCRTVFPRFGTRSFPCLPAAD